MATTNYAGIDYGLGQSNVDKSNGIRYGVIAQNSVNLDLWNEAEPDFGDPHCPECGGEVIDSSDASVTNEDWNEGKDFACIQCEQVYWSESVYPEEALGYSYDADGYSLTDCLDADIFVLASPYYTYAQFCSPCVPGACNLDSPLDAPVLGDVESNHIRNNNKCYALGHEWFDSGKAPYKLWKVADDSEVLPE